MKRVKNPRCSASMALVCCVLCGCGDGRIEVAPVRGSVLYQGQGVPFASVVFHPVGDEFAQELGKIRPYADADAQGNFELRTYLDGDGAPPGEYQVSIIVIDIPETGRRDRESSDAQIPVKSAVRVPMPIRIKYANKETSGLSVTVHPGENNLDPFTLQ